MVGLYCVFSICVAWLTYVLVKKTNFTPTRSSALVTLAAILILFVSNKVYPLNFNLFAALIFGASFVGMCSHKIISEQEVVLAAIVYTLIFTYLISVISHLGGALGFSAFLSVVLSRWLFKVFATKSYKN